MAPSAVHVSARPPRRPGGSAGARLGGGAGRGLEKRGKVHCKNQMLSFALGKRKRLRRLPEKVPRLAGRGLGKVGAPRAQHPAFPFALTQLSGHGRQGEEKRRRGHPLAGLKHFNP